ncbi:hypothetical protein GJAV_G00109700 [Gymnothorax javanicus]|nr:hypothetical protein GJAV_G00109700 [Gymnothorax javanicus]
MMFRDDTEELKMLYDTNCSSTVVQLPYTGSLAMLLLLPKGEMGHLWPDTCLSVTRMKFWLTNLKPGRAEIRIPKFVLRKSYPLQSILKPTVVQTLFTDSVDLSGFSLNRKLSLQIALPQKPQMRSLLLRRTAQEFRSDQAFPPPKLRTSHLPVSQVGFPVCT